MKTKITLLFIVLFNSFVKYYASEYQFREAKTILAYEEQYHELASLYELIIADIDQAEIRVKNLIKNNLTSKNKIYLADLYTLQCELYRSKGDITYMKLSFYQALALSYKLNDEFNKILLDFYLTVNQSVNAKFKKEEQNLKSLLLKIKNKKYSYIEARVHQALGKFYSKHENYRLANEHYNLAQNIFTKIGFSVISYEIDIAKGINFFWNGRFSKALAIFHQTKQIAKNKNYEKCYANSLLNLGEAHLHIKTHLDSSIYYLNEFIKIKNTAEIRDVFHAYSVLSEYYKEIDNLSKSYFYKDLMYEVENEIRLNMVSHVNEEIDEVYAKMRKERNLDEENNRQKLLKILFGLVGLFFLLITIVFWFIIREKGKLNGVLLQQKDEINSKKNQLNLALKEKEILLKEIHHRVKNNLQIISSLLSLQSKNISDEKAKNAIFEGKERIQAIALIHQKLYQNDTYASIEMKTYLDDLIKQLGISYDNQIKKIDFVIETNNIVLNLDTVVPLGLIICELVTNTYKYAFKNIENPMLKITISEIEDENLQLLVKDNGVGMKESFDFLQSPTLGVEIIQALTEQLDGSISYKSTENGTSIRIKFKGVINDY